MTAPAGGLLATATESRGLRDRARVPDSSRHALAESERRWPNGVTTEHSDTTVYDDGGNDDVVVFVAPGTTMNRRPLLCCAVLAIALSAAAASADDGERPPRRCATGRVCGCPRAASERFADYALNGLSGEADRGLVAVSAGTGRDEGRGKRTKKKKIKNTSTNVLVGGSVMAAMVVMFAILNAVTVTLGKAFLFTFITKFLVAVNWTPGGGSSSHDKKSPDHKDVTVLLD